jgi:hypothetical protein
MNELYSLKYCNFIGFYRIAVNSDLKTVDLPVVVPLCHWAWSTSSGGQTPGTASAPQPLQAGKSQAEAPRSWMASPRASPASGAAAGRTAQQQLLAEKARAERLGAETLPEVEELNREALQGWLS